jgi:hypothetical protein
MTPKSSPNQVAGTRPRTAGDNPHQRDLSERTRAERDDLVECMHRLEAALASPAPGREREWAARASQDLIQVRESLQQHILSAEGPSGLFAELDLSRVPIPARVTQLREEHHQLLEMAQKLADDLRKSESLPDFMSLRQEAAQFLTLLRRHHASEVDLIYECFWLDIGVGD